MEVCDTQQKGEKEKAEECTHDNDDSSDSDMPAGPTEEDRLLAVELAASYYPPGVEVEVALLNRGWMNGLFLASAPTLKQEVIVRLPLGWATDRALKDYEKEKWCTQQVLSLGLPSPKIIALGEMKGKPYMILTRVNGTDCKHFRNKSKDMLAMWKSIGTQCKAIHAQIAAQGLGVNFLLEEKEEAQLSDKLMGHNMMTWREYVDLHISCLDDPRERESLGFVSVESEQMRGIFESLRGRTFNFGLCHADLNVDNTMVLNKRIQEREKTEDHEFVIVDWGIAEIQVVPHIEILRAEIFEPDTPEEMKAWLEGYGMSFEALLEMKGELLDMQVLSTFHECLVSLHTDLFELEDNIETLKDALRNQKDHAEGRNAVPKWLQKKKKRKGNRKRNRKGRSSPK